MNNGQFKKKKWIKFEIEIKSAVQIPIGLKAYVCTNVYAYTVYVYLLFNYLF